MGTLRPWSYARRVRGAILGGAIGDALGAPIEFLGPSQIRADYPDGLRELTGGRQWLPGETTDDSALLLATAEGYAAGSPFDIERAAAAMVRWARSGPKDIGIQTSGVLRMIGDKPARARRAAKGYQRLHPNAAGNGSLMRCAPTGIVRRWNSAEVVVEAVRSSEITHADPRCTGSCVAYCAALATLCDAGSVDLALQRALAGGEISREVGAIVQGVIKHSRPLHRYSPIGYVLLGLERALLALRDATDFEEALVEVANQGGDSDTNAAIAGGLLGARFGVDAIPARWLADLRDRARFEQVAADLARQGA